MIGYPTLLGFLIYLRGYTRIRLLIFTYHSAEPMQKMIDRVRGYDNFWADNKSDNTAGAVSSVRGQSITSTMKISKTKPEGWADNEYMRVSSMLADTRLQLKFVNNAHSSIR